MKMSGMNARPILFHEYETWGMVELGYQSPDE